MNNYIRSPLRYPGGKQRDVLFLGEIIKQFLQDNIISEYREPFLGGGSMLLSLLSGYNINHFWGNDAHPLLIDFWQQSKDDVTQLCTIVESLKEEYTGPRKKSKQWTTFRIKYHNKLNNLEDNQLYQAARFFILNRSTASGTTESGGLTPLAYCERFTESSIERLRLLGDNLKNVTFTCGDYSRLLTQEGKNTFIFLDPPYLSAEKSALYGKSGNLHKGFDHNQLAQNLQHCSHHWLMTIDDCPEVIELYSNWAYIFRWSKFYGMTNFDGRKTKSGKELLVSSFSIDHLNLSKMTGIKTTSVNCLSKKVKFMLKGDPVDDAEKIIQKCGKNPNYLIKLIDELKIYQDSKY